MEELKYLIKKYMLLLENRGSHLMIGHGSKIYESKLGVFNTIYANVKISNCIIGDYVYVSENTIIRNTTIGRFCSIGPGCRIGPTRHPTNYISTFPAFFSTRKQCQFTFSDKNYFQEILPCNIGNDVWIGSDSIVMDGVVIGDGAIIAAGSVVTKNVGVYEIVGGVPAKLIRKRFADNQIEMLLDFKWWDKDYQWLKTNFRLFNKPIQFFNCLSEELTRS
jgi:acetyltransferase-like isoleucine patch superfamily enzyme